VSPFYACFYPTLTAWWKDTLCVFLLEEHAMGIPE
jgi:hypothetical protein